MLSLPNISINELFEAKVFLGHRINKWNPKMSPYIYSKVDGIHIIDLQQTRALLKLALKKLHDVAQNNGKILFVGTKIQAKSIISECAKKCGQYYVNHHWSGGTLTNWGTSVKSISNFKKLKKLLENEESSEIYTKKEISKLEKQKEKLSRVLSGIEDMRGAPDLIVVLSPNKDFLSIKEANTLGIPIIAIMDTDSDPTGIDYPIPGNDDSTQSISLYCNLFADSVLAGTAAGLVKLGIDIGEEINDVDALKNMRKKAESARKENKSNFSKKVHPQKNYLKKENNKENRENNKENKDVQEKTEKIENNKEGN